jgi:3-hydroxyisobutyrate dehydrogenase
MKITVLGTGTMGSPIAANLCRAGFATTVWDREPANSTPLAKLGATVASSPVEAVAGADAVITMLPNLDAVMSVFDEQGTLEGLAPGAIWVQMGTLGVAAIDRLLALRAERRPDVSFVDAPVSGSKGPAEQGELLILASGPRGIETKLEGVFDVLGRRTMWLGEAGRGTRLKLVLNTWIAFLMEGLAETVTLADGLGVPHAELADALEGGPLAAPQAIAKLRKIDAGDYDPEFALAWALKDVDLALESVLEHLPALAAIGEQWHRATADGYGGLDISAARLALDPQDSDLRLG